MKYYKELLLNTVNNTIKEHSVFISKFDIKNINEKVDYSSMMNCTQKAVVLSHEERCILFCNKLNKSLHYAKNINDKILDQYNIPKIKWLVTIYINDIDVNEAENFIIQNMSHFKNINDFEFIFSNYYSNDISLTLEKIKCLN